MAPSSAPRVRVESLSVDYWQGNEWVNVVNKVSFSICQGEILGLAGESGCGKTTTAYALLAYHKPGGRIREGKVLFEGRDLFDVDERELQSLRGAQISLVPQNAASALSPGMRVGSQIGEVIKAHRVYARTSAVKRRVFNLLEQVGLPESEVIAKRYPHQLSGGQKQRVAIAMAIACDPSLLVLDEPTTGLDVTTQAQILNLLLRLQAERSMAMLYVTHNLGVLAQISDRIAVMYAGELVEVAPTEHIFNNPYHPYTRGLIAAVPRISAPTSVKMRIHGFLQRDQLPVGCRFAPRCDHASRKCFDEPQILVEANSNHWVACHSWQYVAVRGEAKVGTGTCR